MKRELIALAVGIAIGMVLGSTLVCGLGVWRS